MAKQSVNPEFVERYQLELSRNPRSRVFAALAEAYRKMGLLEEAKRICRFGCQAHPDFAGGHVAYAKVLLDLKALPEALTHLEAAARLSPDNLLAHTLMGETLIELRRPKDALKAFKMVLFLDPENARANQAVRKWEFLTADEYGQDVFSMKPIFQEPSEKENKADDELDELMTQAGIDPAKLEAATPKDSRSESRLDLQARHQRALERAVSLADAFTVRNDLHAALQVLEDARRLLGPMGEIENRYRLLNKRLEIIGDESEDDADDELESPSFETKDEVELPKTETPSRRAKLEMLLRRINDRRVIG